MLVLSPFYSSFFASGYSALTSCFNLLASFSIFSFFLHFGKTIACLTAIHMGVPVVFAKKSAGSNMDADVYSTEIKSFTHNKTNHVIVSKKYLNGGDHILIIDDFLANGCAVEGLMDLVDQAGGTVEGVGICIEKGFQGGGDALRKKGVNLKSLAIIEKMDAKTGTIVFR